MKLVSEGARSAGFVSGFVVVTEVASIGDFISALVLVLNLETRFHAALATQFVSSKWTFAVRTNLLC